MDTTKDITPVFAATVLHVVIIYLAVLTAGCAPDSSFKGSGEVASNKTLSQPQPSTGMTPPSDDQTVTNDLNPQDEVTLKSCQVKLPSLLQGIKVVEVQEIASTISNIQSFVDTYSGDEKRVLIINVKSGISNQISMQLGNRNTIYCLNISSQIVNKIDIGIIRGARLIEARQNSIMNSIRTHQI